MRLLYVCSDFGIAPDGTKGASVHLREITRGLATLGHDVRLLSPKGGPGPPFGDDHPARRLLPPGCPLANKTSRALKKWLGAQGLDDTIARDLRPLLWNAWIPDQVSELLAEDPPDAIIERLSLYSGVGLDLASTLNVPLIVEVNAPLVEEAVAYRSVALRSLAEEIDERVLTRADAITTVSSELADHLAARGIARNKIHVVPNGVDWQAFENLPTREACRPAWVCTMNS